jgi:CBS domain-containing protein
MAVARDLLRNRKADAIFSISPDATVLEAQRQLAEKNIGALLVMGPGGTVEGVLSERDIVRKLDLQRGAASKTRVREIMTAKVLYVEADESLEDCMALMNEKAIRHLPVYDRGELLGMLSIRDVLRTIITEQKIVISHLEQYIRNG